MAKRLSEKQKEEIVSFFTSGISIEELATDFKSTKLTISRNLKKILGEKKFKELTKKNKLTRKSSFDKNNFDGKLNEPFITTSEDVLKEENFSATSFVEITPLNHVIDNEIQKDFASIPIAEIQLPEIVFMIVDKNIELETKYLKDYPDWDFLSQDELNRKTIQIYEDIKNAKRFCKKDQKVIKVPNTNVFRIVAPLLLSRGISRIVTSDKLKAL